MFREWRLAEFVLEEFEKMRKDGADEDDDVM